jgi:ComF family protein
MNIETLRRPLTRLTKSGIDLLFPPRCVICNKFSEFICETCADLLPRALPPRCSVCWEPTISPTRCQRCLNEPRSFIAARSSFIYRDRARTIVHTFKYSYVSALARPMASLMAEALVENFPRTAVLVPVPLSTRRERVRGYNQAKLLASELNRITGHPLGEKALVRVRSTSPQVRQDAVSRHANMRGAFKAREAILPAGASVVLIDDVITSGATVEACAQALREIGISDVFALAFARED